MHMTARGVQINHIHDCEHREQFLIDAVFNYIITILLGDIGCG